MLKGRFAAMKKIGFIGVGIMGKSMVRNLMKADYEVNIYARNKEKVLDIIGEGAIFHENIAECVKGCEAVITIVGYPQDVEDVYFGEGKIIESADPGAYLIDMTTTSPELDSKISEIGVSKGLHVLDAPVTGGDRGARAGTLSILVGGEKADFDECLELFKAMGENITYYGPSGSGQHAKLANQILQAGALSGVCEALSYAKEKGLDPDAFLKGAMTGAGRSFMLESYGPRIIDEDFAPGFFIDFFIKDMKLAYEAASESGLELKVLKQALENYEQLAERGYGRLGMQGLAKFYDRESQEF